MKLEPSLAASFCLCLPWPLFAPSLASAAISLVAWNSTGNSTTSTVDFQRAFTQQSPLDLDNDTFADDSRYGITLGELTPLSGDYTDGKFYGGLSINQIDRTDDGSLASGNYSVHNANTDHIVVHTQHDGNHHHTFDALFYWDKADFLNGGNSAPIILDGTSLLSVSTLSSSLLKGDEHLHFVIRDGSQFYISEQYYGSTGGSNKLGDFPDGATATLNPNLTNWSVYNPSGLDLHFSGTTFASQTFTNITALGFLMDTTQFSANSSRIEISEFAADGFTAVPEPTQAMGVGLLLASAFFLRIRPRRIVCDHRFV